MGNLSYQVDDVELRKIFEKYGEVVDVHIPRHFHTGLPRGFAFVTYGNPRDAEDALYGMDECVVIP